MPKAKKIAVDPVAEADAASTMLESAEDTTPPSAGPVKIDAVKIQLPSIPPALTFEYWVGATADCPLASITVGGQDFPRETELVTVDAASGETKRYPKVGKIVRLSKEQVERVVASAPKKFVRRIGNRAYIVNKDHAGFAPQPEDVCVARYIYLNATGGKGEAVCGGTPEPMAS